MRLIFLPFFILMTMQSFAQPSISDIKKFRIKKVQRDEDGKYGAYLRSWYYNKKGEDSLTINHGDTVMTRYVYKMVGLTQKILSRANSEEKDIYDYTYNLDKSYKVTFTDGHFKMKSYEWFDSKDRKTKAQYPDGNVITYKYDPKGNVISILSDGHNEGIKINRKYSYNAKGQVIRESAAIDGRISSTISTYDVKGKLIKEVETGQLDDDAIQNITLYEYNEKGLLKKTTYKSIYPDKPSEEVVTFVYQYTYEYY